MANNSAGAPTFHEGAEVEHIEKKTTGVDVPPSIHHQNHQTSPRGWLDGLRSRFGFPQLTRGQGLDGTPPVYQPRAPPPAGSRVWKFLKFLGPGAIISVAYVDPDNYQTAISSGSSFQYKLLFMVLVSNIIAIYIQVDVFPLCSSRGHRHHLANLLNTHSPCASS